MVRNFHSDLFPSINNCITKLGNILKDKSFVHGCLHWKSSLASCIMFIMHYALCRITTLICAVVQPLVGTHSDLVRTVDRLNPPVSLITRLVPNEKRARSEAALAYKCKSHE